MSRRLIAVLVPFGLAILFIQFAQLIPELTSPQFENAKDYIMQRGYAETGAKNLVSAIYLDYRLFDSLFEAGILLITVVGIVFMAKSDEDVY
ncbi:hypothetical protein SANA_22540 [Gottschalkiaceae bacterium SANA]|nr:hypothetical protein SANA_22540 [Gottschalkiaceae bacterium SANA]